MNLPKTAPDTEAEPDFDPNGPLRCRDFDEDCFGLDHHRCWLLDPTQGIYPFIAARPCTKERREG